MSRLIFRARIRMTLRPSSIARASPCAPAPIASCAARALWPTATCRASFGLYNTRDEVDGLARALIKAQIFSHDRRNQRSPAVRAGCAISRGPAAVTAEGSGLPADELARLSDDIVAALKTVYDRKFQPTFTSRPDLQGRYQGRPSRRRRHDSHHAELPFRRRVPIMVENAVASVRGSAMSRFSVVWDPPWDPSRMSDEARLVLNMW